MSDIFSNADGAFAYVANECLNGDRKRYGNFETVGVHGMNYALDMGDTDLCEGFRFPLITTRAIPWKSVLVEALWFLAGSDDVGLLQRHGVKFWDPWADANGKVACSYGKFWRKVQLACTSEVGGCQQEHDQIESVLHLLQKDPTSRRAVVSAWQPAMFKSGALVPCPFAFQFLRAADDRLDMFLTQRSNDIALGLPFNMAGAGFLHCMFARTLGVPRGVFYHSIGDAHVYASGEYDHTQDLYNQIRRTPREQPLLNLTKTDRAPVRSAREHEVELLHSTTSELLSKYDLWNYFPNPPLKYKVVVT